MNKTYSQIRVLYYPPVPSIQWSSLPEYRIKEHTDYGTFTLLLADKNGGLEVPIRTMLKFGLLVEKNYFLWTAS